MNNINIKKLKISIGIIITLVWICLFISLPSVISGYVLVLFIILNPILLTLGVIQLIDEKIEKNEIKIEKEIRQREIQTRKKRCPFCNEKLQYPYKFCYNCFYKIDKDLSERFQELYPSIFPNGYKCPYCNSEPKAISVNVTKKGETRYLKVDFECELCGWNSIDKEKKSRYIPKRVKREVWRRDQGKCVECGSKERLEFDHIIPFSKGGSNTVRNIQLLCERCNREKYNNI